MNNDTPDMLSLLTQCVEALQLLNVQPTVSNVRILHATHQAIDAVISMLKSQIEKEDNADV